MPSHHHLSERFLPGDPRPPGPRVRAANPEGVDYGNKRPRGSQPWPRLMRQYPFVAMVLAVIAVVAALFLATVYLFISRDREEHISTLTSVRFKQFLTSYVENVFPEEGLKNLRPADLTGTYELVSYDQNYESYLKALGIPFFVVPIILGMAEKLEVAATSDPHGKWTLITKTDILERKSEFYLGQEFEMVWGRNQGVMHNVCTLPTVNVLKCTSEEREKGWNFVSEMIFSDKGIINERYFQTKGIRTKKYFQRVDGPGAQVRNREDVEFEQEVPEDMIAVGGGEEDSPFSDDSEEDEDFWDDE